MTKEQALELFAIEYIKHFNLHTKPAKIKSMLENKLVETHNAFYMHGLELKINKGE